MHILVKTNSAFHIHVTKVVVHKIKVLRMTSGGDNSVGPPSSTVTYIHLHNNLTVHPKVILPRSLGHNSY